MDQMSGNGPVFSINLYERLLRKYELMQSVFSIISRKDLSFSQQIDSILREGCKLFDQDIGIVSEIIGSKYIVKNVYAADQSIERGQTFELEETFCSIAMESKGPLSIADASNSRWTCHPCTKSGLNSYIGVPIMVDDRPFGTLNFSSFQPKPSPFSDIDIEFVQTLGDWVSMVLARSIMLDELHILATHDSLTGLPNRKYFQKRLESCIQRSDMDRGYSFALLFIDLDRFKQVNDTYGHYTGDVLLKEIATRIEEHVRPRDNIGRFAGDEFILLVEDVTVEQVMDIAERILESIKMPMEIEGVTLDVDASIGISMSTCSQEARGLIELADQAMYRAKNLNHGICIVENGTQVCK
jgi:diguanylate cyclase (GGDEF)-like protein